MNALELALQGTKTNTAPATTFVRSVGGYKMANALLAWADKHRIQHPTITALRKAVAAGGRVIDEIDAVWFELPESIEVRAWRPLPDRHPTTPKEKP